MTVDFSNCMTVIRSSGQKDFTFQFRTFPDTDKHHTLEVFILKPDGTTKAAFEGSDRDFVVDWRPQSSIVQFIHEVPSGEFVVMYSNVPFTQDLTFARGTKVDGYILDNALDKLTMLILQLKCQVNLAVKTKIDPKTGVIPQVHLEPLVPDKMLAVTHDGKGIVPSAYTLQDFLDLKAAIDAAAAAAAASAQSATASQVASAASEAKAKQSETNAKNSEAAALQAKTDTQLIANKAKTDIQLLADKTKIEITDLLTIGKRDLNGIITAGLHDIQLLAQQSTSAITTEFNQAKNDLDNLIGNGKSEITTLTTQSKNDLNAIKTAVDAQYLKIKPMLDLLASPIHPDDILHVDANGHWVKTSAANYVTNLLKGYLTNGQLLWRDQDAIKGIDLTTITTGTGGTFDFSTVFTGQDDGTAPVTDSSKTDKYSMQKVLSILHADPNLAGQIITYNTAGDGFSHDVNIADVLHVAGANPSLAGKVVVYSADGSAFSAIDPADLRTGLGADYTAPVTIATAPHALKQLSVMCADKDGAADRAGKIGRISDDASIVTYENFPIADELVKIIKTDPTVTVDTSILIPSGQSTEVFNNLVAHYNPTTTQWEITLGGQSMGGSLVPTPPTTGQHFLGSEMGVNGVVYNWFKQRLPEPTAADNGKVAVYDHATDKFKYVTPMADNPVTRSVIAETGAIGAINILAGQTDIIFKNSFTLQYADPTTSTTTTHDFASNTRYTIQSSAAQEGFFWLYADPADSFTLKHQSTEPTTSEKLHRVYLCVFDMVNFGTTSSPLFRIVSIKPIYNEIAHKEYVLRELGDAVGTVARGVFCKIVDATSGLVPAIDGGRCFSFLSRQVPVGTTSKYNASTLYFKKDSKIKLIPVVNHTIDATTAMLDPLSVKKYVDNAGVEHNLAAGNTSTTVHYIYAPAQFNDATGDIETVYMVIGNTVYDSISAAKEDLASADANQSVPSFITRNCTLIGKLFIRFDSAYATPTSWHYMNTANISAKAVSVIHAQSLPDPVGVANDTPLVAQNGHYAFSSAPALTIADPTAIADGDILAVQGGHAIGINPANIGFDLTHIDKKLKFEYVVLHHSDFNSGAVTIPATDSKIEASTNIKSVERNAAGGLDTIIINLNNPITTFDRVIVLEEGMRSNSLGFLPVFVDNTDPVVISFKLNQIPNFSNNTNSSSRKYKIIIYYY